MYYGTLCGQWEAIITFQQMIVLSDDEGFVDMMPKAISARTSIPLEIIEKGIKILENKKQIIHIYIHIPFGWQIPGHLKYKKVPNDIS